MAEVAFNKYIEQHLSFLTKFERVKISLDVDGVLADFYKSICLRYDKKQVNVNQFYVPWIKEYIEEVYHDISFWLNLPTLLTADDIKFSYDYYITALPIQAKSARIVWLNNNRYADKLVYLSHEKHLVVNDMNINVHVDDKLSTCVDIADKSEYCVPILYLPYYLEYDESKGKNHMYTKEGNLILIARSADELNATVDKLNTII